MPERTDTLPPMPGGLIDGPRHLFAVRAYYEDTDLSGIVYHANYLRWFERARSDLLRLLEIDQREAVEAGVREGLQAYFAPHNRALEAALGREMGWGAG